MRPDGSVCVPLAQIQFVVACLLAGYDSPHTAGTGAEEGSFWRQIPRLSTHPQQKFWVPKSFTPLRQVHEVLDILGMIAPQLA